MNLKKIAITVSVTLVLLAITTMNSYAALDWYLCKVTGTGIGSNGEVFIMLEDTSSPTRFTPRWFIPARGLESKTLAIALKAESNDSRVVIYADPEQPQNVRELAVFLTYK